MPSASSFRKKSKSPTDKNSKTVDEKKMEDFSGKSIMDVFRRGDDNDEEEDEEDQRILNMSLIKNVIGNSTANGLDGSESPMKPNRVTFEGVESVASTDDEEKNRDELVQKIGKLSAKVTQAEIDKSAEKAMRKKKEKSLVKLAKELNKRAADQVEKEKTINKLKTVSADLEAKLHATRSEMDERILTNEKKTKEYNKELDDAHSKYRSVVAEHDFKQAELVKNHVSETETLRRTSKEAEIECERLRTQIGQVKEHVEARTVEITKLTSEKEAVAAEAQKAYKAVVKEHESRVSDMNKKHAEQMDAMRKKLLSSNLECDKIRTQLASLQMKAAPGDADAIMNRTMKSASFIGDIPEKKSVLPLLVTLGVVVLAVVVGFFTLNNTLCAPVRPGTMIDTDMTAVAPWWAPGSEQAFQYVCGSRPQTKLQWIDGRLVVENAIGDVLLTRKTNAAAVNADSINFFDKKGKIESVRAPWSK